MALCGVIEGIPCPTVDPGFWTPWLDRDNPSGSGDFENVVNYMKNDLEEENLAMYSKYFKTILEFIQLDLTKIDAEGKTTLDDIVSKIRNSELTDKDWSTINGAVEQKRVEMNLDKDKTVFKIFKRSFLELIESESMI